jgi:hypothetical protein
MTPDDQRPGGAGAGRAGPVPGSDRLPGAPAPTRGPAGRPGTPDSSSGDTRPGRVPPAPGSDDLARRVKDAKDAREEDTDDDDTGA